MAKPKRPAGRVGKAAPAKDAPVSRNIPVERVVPESVRPTLADGMVVHQRDGHFIVSFLQTRYPLVLLQREVDKIEKVDQQCIVQLVITPHSMAKNLAALNDSFERFKAKQSDEVKASLEKAGSTFVKGEVSLETTK